MPPVPTVALIGLGTMGPGIAARLARGGLAVQAYDTAPAAVERARAAVPLAMGVLDRLRIHAPDVGEGQIRFAGDLAEAVAGAHLVIENVPESLELKGAVYRAIEPLVGPDTLLASDTSGIPITRLQAFLDRPGRLAGMHWSNPPHIVPMIEVIGGERTDPATVETLVALIRGIGLIPIVIRKDVPGFVENRVLYALLREAIDLVEQGVVSAEDLDTCVSWGIGYKLSVIGPMALLDMAGLDIYRSVATFLNAELCARTDVAPLIAGRAAAGHLGIKSGEGLMRYTPERIRELQALRAQRLVEVRLALEGRL